MTLLFKIITLLVSLAAISKIGYDFKKRREKFYNFIFWMFIWLIIAVMAIWPKPFYFFAISLSKNSIGIGTFLGAIFVFLLFLIYRLYLRVTELEQKIKNIVIADAIKDLETKK